MTASTSFAAANSLKPTSGREVAQLFATDIAAERTRMLYQGSQVPTLFMLRLIGQIHLLTTHSAVAIPIIPAAEFQTVTHRKR
mgnify:CR=1 FL=1